jgi:lactoylglutathione lyase
MLKLPDDDFVAIELVYDPRRPPKPSSGLSHLVVQVESMKAAIADLAAHHITATPPSFPNNNENFVTSTVQDPDGNEIELVQWPMDHPDGMTAADFLAEE